MVDEAMHLRHQQAMLTILQEIDRVCTKLQIPYVLFAGTLLGAVRHQGFIPWDDDLDVLMFREDYDRFLREAPAFLSSEAFFLQAEFSDHWPMFFSKLRLNGTACIEKYRPKDSAAHHGIYVDIFPCDRSAGTAVGRWMQFLASKVVIAKSLDARGYQTMNLCKLLFMAACRILPSKPFMRMVTSGKPDGKMVHTFLAAGKRYGKNVFPREYFSQRTELAFEGRKYPVPKEFDAVLRRMYGDYMHIPTERQRALKIHAVSIEMESAEQSVCELSDYVVSSAQTRSIR